MGPCPTTSNAHPPEVEPLVTPERYHEAAIQLDSGYGARFIGAVYDPFRTYLTSALLTVVAAACSSSSAPPLRPLGSTQPKAHHAPVTAQPIGKAQKRMQLPIGGPPPRTDGAVERSHAPDDPGEYQNGMMALGAFPDPGGIIVTILYPIILNLGYGDLFVVDSGGVVRDEMCAWDSSMPGANCAEGIRSVECAMQDLAGFYKDGGMQLILETGESRPPLGVSVKETSLLEPLIDDQPSDHCGGGPHHLGNLMVWYGVTPVPEPADPNCAPEPLPGLGEVWPRAVFYRPPVAVTLVVTPPQDVGTEQIAKLRVNLPGLHEPYQGRPPGIPVYQDGAFFPGMEATCRTTRLPDDFPSSLTTDMGGYIVSGVFTRPRAPLAQSNGSTFGGSSAN